MGVLADAAMGSGGTVVGFIPERLLAREVGHRSISELIVTDSMFDRKDRMIETADAFVVLPGGLGTLDELFEVLTLRQLGYHQKPIILVNVDGFWDPFASLVDQVVRHGFADSEVRGMLQTVDDVDDVLPALGLSECRTSQRADLA